MLFLPDVGLLATSKGKTRVPGPHPAGAGSKDWRELQHPAVLDKPQQASQCGAGGKSCQHTEHLRGISGYRQTVPEQERPFPHRQASGGGHREPAKGSVSTSPRPHQPDKTILAHQHNKKVAF